jgi:hypothetical protein
MGIKRGFSKEESQQWVDYRMLNKNSKKDSYAFPRIEELLFIRKPLLLVIDMKSGYHQVDIFEDHK